MIKKSNVSDFIQYASKLPYPERRIAIARSVKPGQRRFIYKYRPIRSDDNTSIARLRDIIVYGRLWMSSPLDFNDPFDMSMKLVVEGIGKKKINRLKQLVKELKVPRKDRENVMRKLMLKPKLELEKDLEEANARVLEKIGVFSFAGDPRNILMWSHYAQDHTGICIRFERMKDYFYLARALKVDYKEEYPIVNWLEEQPEEYSKVILRKNKGWEYEREERIIDQEGARRYLHINPEAITGIIFGCRATDENRNPVIQLLEERKKKSLPLPKLFEARQHDSRYQLKIFGSQSNN